MFANSFETRHRRGVNSALAFRLVCCKSYASVPLSQPTTLSTIHQLLSHRLGVFSRQFFGYQNQFSLGKHRARIDQVHFGQSLSDRRRYNHKHSQCNRLKGKENFGFLLEKLTLSHLLEEMSKSGNAWVQDIIVMNQRLVLCVHF